MGIFNDDDDDEQQEVPEGLIDFKAISDILLRAKDALRPIGITLELNPPPTVAMNGKLLVVMAPMIIRPSAKTKLDEDRATKDQLNMMLAQQADEQVNSTLEEMRQIARDPARLKAYMAGEIDSLVESACEHKRRHPSGHCLDCGEGL